MPQDRRFSAWASGSGFGAAICVAVVRTVILLCFASASLQIAVGSLRPGSSHPRVLAQ